MKSSDEIFQLIRAMSDKEKRFFRKKYTLFVSDEDKNYINLFDEISKQATAGENYSEEKIKEGKYSGKFIKNLSFHKNFLYNTIINSLSLFHKDSKEIFSVRNQLSQSEILFDKMLYDQSRKILQRIKKSASGTDLFNNLFEIINTERTIAKYMSSVEEYVELSEGFFEEQYKILELQKNTLDYLTLNEKVGIFLRNFGSGRARDTEKLNEFEKIFENQLLKNVENAKTFFSRYIFYNLRIQYFLTNENFEEAYINALAATELWENNPDKIAGKPDNYIYSLYNLLNCQGRTKRYSEFEITADKFKNLEKKFPDNITESNRVFIFYSLSVLTLTNYMGVFDTVKLRSIETEINHGMKLFEEKITLYQRIILYYFLSASNFIQSDFEKCIYWTGKIFNLGKTDLSEDYQCYARIIQLISYYELGYFDSMEYSLKSGYQFISKKKKIYKYENVIQKYLRRSFRIKTEKEIREMLIEMKSELELLSKDPFEKNAFDAFNIIYWLDARIRNVPVLQVLKEKIEN